MIHDYGQFSEGEVRLFQQIVSEGDFVIEVGAAIGCHTIPIAKAVGSKGSVIAMEPQSKFYNMLCGSIALNDLSNVTIVNMAASNHDGSMFVPELDYNEQNNFGGLSLSDGGPGRLVAAIRLDALLHQPLHRLRLIKVDVEGMELRVLTGAQKLIERFRPFLYVENDRPKKSAELLRLIRDMGYRMYWHLPLYVEAENVMPEFAGMVSVNVFCVPNEIECEVHDMKPITSPEFL
jgi:FkbM family methyltransferase